MRFSFKSSQQGIAHLGLILVGVLVLGVAGFAGWKVMNGGKDTAAEAVSRKALEAACTEEDKNICKFQASWKSQEYYTVVSKTTAEGLNSESTYKSEGKDKFHMITKGDVSMEMITIGNTSYTKAPNGTWWKQTVKPEEVKKYTENFDYDEPEEDKSDTKEQKDTTTYKNLGTEACGNLTCYKYQVVDSSTPDDKEFIWFDTKDYQLRKQRSESKDGTVSESTYSYDKISIKAPSPVKELGPNQYLMPGQNEPTTMPDPASVPDASSLDQYMNSLPEGSGEDGSAEQ